MTVVIPSWNGRELLGRVLLPSLARQRFTGFRTLLVDNGSTDGSVEAVRNEWPDVEVIELARNVGFAAAVNRGVEQSTSEFVALVNNDVELDPDWLTELVGELDARPEAASATGKIRHFDERDTIYAAGDELTHYLEMFNRGRNEPDRGQYDAPEDVLSGCAAATLYRRAAFDVVGVFDEDFFAYAEDVDWGVRAQLRGMTCRYVPTALAYHIGGATNERVGISERYTLRNSLWLAVKNLPAPMLIRNLHRIAFIWARAMFRWTRAGHGGHAFWAARGAVAMLPTMFAKRRAIRADATVEDAYVESLISKRRTASAKLDWLEGLPRRVLGQPRAFEYPAVGLDTTGERVDIRHRRARTRTEVEHWLRYAWAAEQVHGRVLDAGCGSGYGSALLAANGEVFGLDYDEAAVAAAQTLVAYGTFVVARPPIVPFEAEFFDAVVSFETIEHVDDDATFAAELHRVLRPGGRLLMSTPNAAASEEENPWHVREYSLEELLALLSSVGFERSEVFSQRVVPRSRLRKWAVGICRRHPVVERPRSPFTHLAFGSARIRRWRGNTPGFFVIRAWRP